MGRSGRRLHPEERTFRTVCPHWQIAAGQSLSHFRLCDPLDCSPPGNTVLQARTPGWVAIPFPRGSSRSRDRAGISGIGRWILPHQATEKARCRRDIQMDLLSQSQTRVQGRRGLLTLFPGHEPGSSNAAGSRSISERRRQGVTAQSNPHTPTHVSRKEARCFLWQGHMVFGHPLPSTHCCPPPSPKI